MQKKLKYTFWMIGLIIIEKEGHLAQTLQSYSIDKTADVSLSIYGQQQTNPNVPSG